MYYVVLSVAAEAIALPAEIKLDFRYDTTIDYGYDIAVASATVTSQRRGKGNNFFAKEPT